MKILHLVKTSIGATWALRQMRELVQLGVAVHVAIPPGPLVSKYQAAGVHVHLAQVDFPTRQPQKMFERFSTLRQIVDHIRPDIIHSHFVGTTLTMRLALGRNHKTPRIFQIPGPLHLEQPLLRRAEIGLAGAPDYWIGSCQWTSNRYRQSGIANKRIFLSFYGTDIDDFSQNRPGKLRQELGLSSNKRIVGMVAFLYAPKYFLGQTRGLKGHEDLIDALALRMADEPNLVGVFIGGAWENAHTYEQKVRAYGKEKCGARVYFLGSRTDVPRLYPDFELAVHPSHSENLGGAAESLLMGIPTIATNIGGFPDLVQPNKTGWLVPPKCPQKLAETIGEALAHPDYSRSLARRGQEYARHVLDVRITAQEIFTIYQTILGQDRSA